MKLASNSLRITNVQKGVELMRTMRITKKRLTTYVLAFVMILTSMIVMTPQKAEAAGVQRKISEKAVTLDIGKSYTLHVLTKKREISFGEVHYCWAGEYYVKKFITKWSSSNTKVATVTSKGKVTAKAKGTAVITAKVGKTSYKCKVTVLRPISKKNIKVKSIPTAKTYWVGSLFEVTNKNDYTVEVEFYIVYTKGKKKIPTDEGWLIVGPGETVTNVSNGPGNYDKAEFKIKKIEKCKYKNAVDAVEVKISKDGNTLSVKNNGDFTITRLIIMCYKCDDNGLPHGAIVISEDDFPTKKFKPGKTYSIAVNEPETNWLAVFGEWVEPDGQGSGYTKPGKPDLILVEEASNKVVNTISVTAN